MNRKIVIAFVAAICCWTSVSAQQFAVKSNLLYWATATPNVGVELALNRHSTLSVSANYNPWVLGQDGKIQHWFVQPEYRYWLSEKFTRSYFGVHLIAGQFEIGGFKLPFNLFPNFQNHYYKGSAVGAGISYGYHFYISPHWNLEAMIGAGLVRIRYHRDDAPSVKKSRILPVPTEVGISFVYLFNSRK